MSLHPRVAGAILAGGRARRMGGADKGSLPLGLGGSDRPLDRILKVFEPRFAQRLIVVSPEGDRAALASARGARVVVDRLSGCGPLGGIQAALAEATSSFVFVCGCDMPWLSGPFVDHLVARAREGRLLVPVHRGRPEPLHAVYPVSCLPEADRALADGVRMMLDFFARVPVDYLPEEEYADVEGALRSFENINTPEDLERVRRGEEEAGP